MSPSTNGNSSMVPAVDRAVQILNVIAHSNAPLGVSDLSRRLGLNKSTVHDIVTTLAVHKFVERDERTRTYRLGRSLAQLAERAGALPDLRAKARPHLAALARAVEETVFLGVYEEDHVTIIDKEDSTHAVKISAPLNHRLYYSVGAFGKVFLAAMPESQADKLLRDKPPRAFTPRSIIKTAAYRAAIQRVRALGYALDDEEYLEGVRAAASPIVDAQGHVLAALCVVGFGTRLPHQKLLVVAKKTRAAADKLSRELGAPAYPMWKGLG